MGEQKRKTSRMDEHALAIQALTRKLMSEGKIVEAGWAAFSAIFPENVSTTQVREMRKAFLAGAQHLWGSIMVGLEEGKEPTDNDMARMDLIKAELERFEAEFAAEHYPTRGNA